MTNQNDEEAARNQVSFFGQVNKFNRDGTTHESRVSPAHVTELHRRAASSGVIGRNDSILPGEWTPSRPIPPQNHKS